MFKIWDFHQVRKCQFNKYFFAYARKKLKTRSKIGPFEMNGEKTTSLLDMYKASRTILL